MALDPGCWNRHTRCCMEAFSAISAISGAVGSLTLLLNELRRPGHRLEASDLRDALLLLERDLHSWSNAAHVVNSEAALWAEGLPATAGSAHVYVENPAHSQGISLEDVRADFLAEIGNRQQAQMTLEEFRREVAAFIARGLPLPGAGPEART
jgi:hypothetical protein